MLWLLVVLYAMYYITLCIVSITHVLLLIVTDLERLLHHLCHVVCIHRGVEDTTTHGGMAIGIYSYTCTHQLIVLTVLPTPQHPMLLVTHTH